MNLFYQMVRGGYRLLFSLCYNTSFHGLENIPKGGAIIAANHASFYDPPLLGVALPEEPLFLTLKQLYERPIFGTLLHHLNALPVGDPKSDLSSMKALIRALNGGRKVVVFPEGQRTDKATPVPLQAGVARLSLKTGCPIVPTWIEGTDAAWSHRRRFPTFGGAISCTFGHPIAPEQLVGSSKSEKVAELLAKIRQEWTFLSE